MQDETRVEVVQGEARAWSRSTVAHAIIEAMSGRAAAEHARNFVTGNWTDALKAADAVAAIRELAFAAPPAGEREACPFCGGVIIGWMMLAGHKFAASYCQTCEARGPTVPFEMKREPIDDTTAPAKVAWAKRMGRADEFRNVLRAFIESHRSPDPYVSYEMDQPVADDRRDEQFAIDVALLDKTYALSHPLPADREAIARVIHDYSPKPLGKEWPLNAADAILALTPTPSAGRDGSGAPPSTEKGEK